MRCFVINFVVNTLLLWTSAKTTRIMLDNVNEIRSYPLVIFSYFHKIHAEPIRLVNHNIVYTMGNIMCKGAATVDESIYIL